MSVEEMLGIRVEPQNEALMGVLNAERSTSEDCLVLNVWTSAEDAEVALPVLVWLHGGAWSTGSASWPLYDFTNLAGHGNVVVVGLNHRVGILGFMDLSQLDDEFADSGNVGMLDIVAALEWVRDNISGFGGDPANVTVFGESGGGAKTAALLAMPAARGLFHKASAMSGSMLVAQEPGRATLNTGAVLEQLGIGSDLEKLRLVDVDALIEAEVGLPGRARSGMVRARGFSPVLGPSLPQHPAEAIGVGISAEVTLLSGCNGDETLGLLFGDPELWTLGIGDVVDRLRLLLVDDAERVLARYRAARPDDSPTSLLIAISSDALFRVPQIRLAEAKIKGGGKPAYMYLYTWGITDPAGRVRAPHGTDMPYFFDNVDKAPVYAGPHADSLVKSMSGTLISLAHTGSPGHDTLPSWPPYNVDERATMLLDLAPAIDHDPFGAERACWDDITLTGIGNG
jgi:para-nitrobenzyl esterase